jgi:predicted acetyltransferase
VSAGVRPCEPGELGLFLRTCLAAFGGTMDDDEVARLAPAFDPARLLLALEEGEVVGAAGTVLFDLSVPGGQLPCGGVTMVGVLPGHRRRGHLSRMMERALEDARAQGEALSVLWSSEGDVYSRFGYGLGVLAGRIDVPRDRATLRAEPVAGARARLVGVDEAMEAYPAIYDAVRAATPGMASRTQGWWRAWRLGGPPGTPPGAPPMFRALLEVDGRPEAYALYRVHGAWEGGVSTARLDVLEAMATTPVGTAEIWRFLLSLDLVGRVRALHLPADHPLLLSVREPARLRFTLTDGLWVRLVDAAAALEARSYAGGDEVVLELEDERCPWNHGRRLLTASPAGAALDVTERQADVRLSIAELGAAYLGGITFEQLARAGRIDEVTPGAVDRLDALFRTGAAPWCADEF